MVPLWTVLLASACQCRGATESSSTCMRTQIMHHCFRPLSSAHVVWMVPLSSLVRSGRHSNCPSDIWHDRAAPILASSTDASGDVVMLNVGANKGFNLAEWMQRYTSADVSNKRWHTLMMKRAEPACELQCCGVCLVCHRKRIRQVTSARLQLHAFELQPSNERLLRQLVALTQAPVEVHGAAVSNASGLVYTRDSGRPGYESVSATRMPKTSRHSIVRNVTTVDAFLSSRRLTRIALVSIDTEGWDAFVMRGMERSLRAKAIDAFEFEYTRAWKPHFGEHALAEHLRWLDDLGYTCFWQGNRGALAQANGGCWREEDHGRLSHRWSNLVCAHRPDLLAAFRATSTRQART